VYFLEGERCLSFAVGLDVRVNVLSLLLEKALTCQAQRRHIFDYKVELSAPRINTCFETCIAICLHLIYYLHAGCCTRGYLFSRLLNGHIPLNSPTPKHQCLGFPNTICLGWVAARPHRSCCSRRLLKTRASALTYCKRLAGSVGLLGLGV
jgi:hypothetical protein